jgi:hypothetical protein
VGVVLLHTQLQAREMRGRAHVVTAAIMDMGCVWLANAADSLFCCAKHDTRIWCLANQTMNGSAS